MRGLKHYQRLLNVEFEDMIKAAGDTGATMIRDLATTIIRDGKVTTDWEQKFIVCLYKGKGDALERDNYQGLNLT